MNATFPLHAFAACGVELEYMIVDRQTLSVLPIADRLLRTPAGKVIDEIPRGHFAWSNEVVLHLIELKNSVPDAALGPLAEGFQGEVRAVNAMLEPLGACLMPSAMHPWMNPARETRLWPHQHADIYRTYDRIFDCRRHGWANLQSMHLNLPFADDAEFVRLHAAIRLVLPILPALAASSPFQEGRFSGFLDTRLEHYRGHQIRVRETIGSVIPDASSGIADYRARALAPMLEAIAPYDPDNVLRHEWLNARGVIPRFERNALEIRVIDMQECPRADLAIAAATGAVVKALYEAGRDLSLDTGRLTEVFLGCIRDGEQALIDDADYLTRLGCLECRISAADLWRLLVERHLDDGRAHWRQALKTILEQGPLARRLLQAVGADITPARLEAVYRELCDCLQAGRMFGGHHD
jgi:gamma-glutamyl:cysteine ligase YbdK (ATP-grasp superfamily)